MSVDEAAFDQNSFEADLEFLDLSGNNLKRLDAKTLANLRRLEKLNVSNNQLSLEAGNFRHNPYLTSLDLSANKIQFLTANVFENLQQIKTLSLADNDLKQVSECSFAHIQTNSIDRKYAPALIILSGNPLECDCALFYLNRVNNYRVEATCSSPIEYKQKNFNDLHRENPAATCKYAKMADKCASATNTRFLVTTVIILSAVTALLLLVLCCCCCKLMSLSDRLDNVRTTLRQSSSRQVTPNRRIYVDASIGNDRDKLIK